VAQYPLRGAYSLALDATLYVLPDQKRFYIQWDDMGASTRHYYGPFDGEALQTLGIPPPYVELISTYQAVVRTEQQVKAGTASPADAAALQQKLNQLKAAAGE
jgi:hypothetical protein